MEITHHCHWLHTSLPHRFVFYSFHLLLFAYNTLRRPPPSSHRCRQAKRPTTSPPPPSSLAVGDLPHPLLTRRPAASPTSFSPDGRRSRALTHMTSFMAGGAAMVVAPLAGLTTPMASSATAQPAHPTRPHAWGRGGNGTVAVRRWGSGGDAKKPTREQACLFLFIF